jgi:hypothetical protein
MMLVITGVLPLRAQEPVPKDTFDITLNTMQFPHYKKVWGFKIAAGLSMVRPPKDLVESSIQAPLVNIQMNYGLPWHLSLESQLTTILVSNQLTLGPHYSFMYRNLGVQAGWDAAFLYGQIRQGGFDNSMVAWLHYPNVSVGYKLKKMAFTLKGEVVLMGRASISSGENEVTHSTNLFLGHTLGLYIEQRIHKDKVFVIGIKNNNLRYFWPTWMIFSTFNRYYNIPELNFTWIL